MRIAVIGRGNIGGTLGAKFAAAGHDVVYGARNPGDGAVSIADAVSGADATLLAIPAGAVGEILGQHGAALDGQLVIDATNNVGAPVANAAAAVAEAAPRARYVRAFNSLGWENFDDPEYGGQRADLFFSAPAADRTLVEDLIRGVGLGPVWLGEGKQDVVDLMLPVWLALWQTTGNRHVALKVLAK